MPKRFRTLAARFEGRKTFAACGVLLVWAVCDLSGLLADDTARAGYWIVCAAIVAALRDALRKVPTATAFRVSRTRRLVALLRDQLQRIPPEDEPTILPFPTSRDG
jgi:hypothetical protein